MRLTDEVKEVLGRSTVTGFRLDLPPCTLDRKLYVKVAAAIEALGGKWDKKEKAHLFDEEAELVVADALATGTIVKGVDLKKQFQFYETPSAVADYVVAKAHLSPGLRVLEPSSGTGNLVQAIFKAAPVDLVAVELNPDSAKACSGREVPLGLDGRRQMKCGDFLACSPEVLGDFDRIVANPPFTRQQDMLHVLHMWRFLKLGGRLVSVMSPGWTFRTSALAKGVQDIFAAGNGQWIKLPENSFKVCGTGADTGVIILDKPTAGAA